jgi:acylphosphatase
MSIQKKILVKGFVQGVSYRKQTRRVAASLGVTGWVRNRSDGNVEACLEGEESAVDVLIAWCAFGPRMGRVDEVLVSMNEFSGTFEDFSIEADRRVRVQASAAVPPVANTNRQDKGETP